jgi:hypothetical protein
VEEIEALIVGAAPDVTCVPVLVSQRQLRYHEQISDFNFHLISHYLADLLLSKSVLTTANQTQSSNQYG